ncbi:hypothetical protein HYFRA_00010907 [Hymenoscyphus fraxineus]|uniref:Uncharacterized protein n=1 Tax=Hymenoscyphus fraxineus TaxID=746836 RepID=A0A9N9PNU7_9HELO|nr:hypothetical protein HYFRA_00010907 [Hymenoscyphus fraxineus]
MAIFPRTFSLYRSGGGLWHEIAQLPLTTRKVSSIVVTVRTLGSRLQAMWEEWHEDHVDQEQEFVTYGDLSDEDRPYRDGAGDGKWEEDSDAEFLIKCCGEDRPMVKNTNLVATPSAGRHFVTIHDYISAVHPWLSSVRKYIITCKILADPEDEDTCPDERNFAATEWVVAYCSMTVDSEGVGLEIQQKKLWIDRNSLGPPRSGPSPFEIQFMVRLRAERQRSGRPFISWLDHLKENEVEEALATAGTEATSLFI